MRENDRQGEEEEEEEEEEERERERERRDTKTWYRIGRSLLCHESWKLGHDPHYALGTAEGNSYKV